MTWVPPTKAAETVYTFGVVPQQSASRLARLWIPLLNAVADRMGAKLAFKTNTDIPTFEACLAKGAYDFAYMNPYHYTVFSKAPGYLAAARQKDKRLQGLLVARPESGISSLDVLEGQVLAFPSPAAFGASVLIRAELRARGIAFEPKYVRSHDSVYRSVADGLFVAGGGVERTFNNLPGAVKDGLEVVYRTKRYTPHAFAGSKDIPETARAAFGEALMAIGAARPELLKPLGMKGFERAQDSDWDDVRALNLTPDQTGIRTGGGATCPFD